MSDIHYWAHRRKVEPITYSGDGSVNRPRYTPASVIKANDTPNEAASENPPLLLLSSFALVYICKVPPSRSFPGRSRYDNEAAPDEDDGLEPSRELLEGAEG